MRILSLVVCLVLSSTSFASDLTDQQAALLYGMAHSLSGYKLPEVAPTVHITSRAKLCDLLKAKPDCRAMGITMPDGTIYMADTLDYSEPYDASALLHEMVHYLQIKNLGPTHECKEWMRRETEAFSVQELVLRKVDADMHDIIRARYSLSQYRCKETE